MTGQIPPDLLVRHVASTFILVLNWWVESPTPLHCKDVNTLFRALMLPTLTATFAWTQRFSPYYQSRTTIPWSAPHSSDA